MNNRVLIVDDDVNLLSGLKRQLHRKFDVEIAQSGEQALERIAERDLFAVVVCDMRMPGLSGVETLACIRDSTPDTVRMMLTGNVDQQTAVDAVNEGHIFRFLNKPVATPLLIRALNAGVEQHRLITAEKQVLSETLTGSVRVLTSILSFVDPAAFARTSRVRRVACELGKLVGLEDPWEIELAASLSQLGCVESLSPGHDGLVQTSPAQFAHDLISNIPRLESVSQIVAKQNMRLDQSAGSTIDSIPLGARVLKVALDFDDQTKAGATPLAACLHLQSRSEWYDVDVLEALAEWVGISAPANSISVHPVAIPDDAILADDLHTSDGKLLLSKGQEISHALRQRLIDYAATNHIANSVLIIDETPNADFAPSLERLGIPTRIGSC